MRVVIQRVTSASVDVDTHQVGKIEEGLLLLIGFGRGDSSESLRATAEKIVNMRIFSDESGRFNRSIVDIKGGILAVPQFTLYADTSKGRRPYFGDALAPELAEPLFNEFVDILRGFGEIRTESGKFGAHMDVTLQNDGPVTILLDS